MVRLLSIRPSMGAATVRALGLFVVSYTVASGAPAASPAATTANPRAGVHSASRDSAIYGDPAVAARYWREQHTSDCGEMAVADVVGEITGREPTEREIIALAENTPSAAGPGPIWKPWGFTDMKDLPKLLGHYGVAADNIQTDIDGLKRMLAADRKVIAIVNAETLWNRPGKRNVANHFVVVTGIDARSGIVHLNDSAIAAGGDVTFSVASFEQAWVSNSRSATVTH